MCLQSLMDLVVGLVFYAVFMNGLTWWDEHVLPELQERGMMPRIPGEPVRLSKQDRALPWLTPGTADRSVPLPSYGDLVSACHRIGVWIGSPNFYQLCENLLLVGLQRSIRDAKVSELENLSVLPIDPAQQQEIHAAG